MRKGFGHLDQIVCNSWQLMFLKAWRLDIAENLLPQQSSDSGKFYVLITRLDQYVISYAIPKREKY